MEKFEKESIEGSLQKYLEQLTEEYLEIFHNESLVKFFKRFLRNVSEEILRGLLKHLRRTLHYIKKTL